MEVRRGHPHTVLGLPPLPALFPPTDPALLDPGFQATIARVVIEEDGAELEVLRHSLPYGTSGESGLYFVAYCRSPAPFRRMVVRDGDGHHDRLLDFTS